MFIRLRPRFVDELLSALNLRSGSLAARPTFRNQSLTPGVLGLQMPQPLNVLSAQFAKFAAPRIDSSLGDAVLPSDVINRCPPRFGQNFYDLAFRKIDFFHRYR